MRPNASAITCALIVELPRIRDVRVETAAAQRIAGRRRVDPATASSTATVVGVRHALADALDAAPDALAGNGAADTSTTWPSRRAIIRPPAAGFSIVERGRMSPGFSIGVTRRRWSAA